MTDPERFRILLPMAPEEPGDEVLPLLSAIFPPPATHVRRLYVSRPLHAEAFLPEMYADFDEIARIDRDARLGANDLARRNSEPLARAGFAVETDVAEGAVSSALGRGGARMEADRGGGRRARSRARHQALEGERRYGRSR